MIRYDLVCEKAHEFDAWFADSASYDDQAARGFLSCPHCGTSKVTKAIMAPRIGRAQPAASPPQEGPGLMDGMPAEVRKALREVRAKMLSGSEDVGVGFSDQARRMHKGEIPYRSIRGGASPDQVRELVEEGVPVAPIPPDLGGH